MRRLSKALLAALCTFGGSGVASANDIPLQPASRVIYPLVEATASTETLIAVVRANGSGGPDLLPLHMNFFDATCLVRNREDDLTHLDVDVYVYSAFATGIAKGAAEIHEADGIHGDSFTDLLIGEAVILDFAADTMVGYSAAAVHGATNLIHTSGTFADNVLGLPHFLAEVSGVLTNEIALAAVPCITGDCNDFFAPLISPDTYPSGSSDLFTVRWRMFDGNEEEASAQTTWKCVLHASLSSIFGDITKLGFLPPDAKDGPQILFYPYGWVRAAIEYAPTPLSGANADRWGATGIFRQRYSDGTFSWAEATNLWNDLPGISGIDD